MNISIFNFINSDTEEKMKTRKGEDDHEIETIKDDFQEEAKTKMYDVINELQKMGFEKSIIQVAIASTRSINIEQLVDKLVSTGKYSDMR